MRRNTIVHYLLTLITGGQYLFIWLFLMAHDINSIKPNTISRLQIKAYVFLAIYILYMAMILYAFMRVIGAEDTSKALAAMPNVAALSILAGAMLAMTAHLVIKIGAFIRTTGTKIPGSGMLLLLTALYMIALPLMQSKLNHLTDPRMPEHGHAG